MYVPRTLTPDRQVSREYYEFSDRGRGQGAPVSARSDEPGGCFVLPPLLYLQQHISEIGNLGSTSKKPRQATGSGGEGGGGRVDRKGPIASYRTAVTP
jgi:hypothetical protein